MKCFCVLSTSSVHMSVYGKLYSCKLSLFTESLVSVCFIYQQQFTLFPTLLVFNASICGLVSVHHTVLFCIKSYTSNRSFSVNFNSMQSSNFLLLYALPQGKFLVCLSWSASSIPLSHIICKSAVNHHLYSDNTLHYAFLLLLLNTLNNICLIQYSALHTMANWTWLPGARTQTQGPKMAK
jgi:hypothetical protein